MYDGRRCKNQTWGATLDQIRKAEAEGYLLQKEAEAKGLELIKNVGVDEATIKLQSFKSMEKVADGKATKIIIPSSIQDFTTKSEMFSDTLKNQ